MQRSALGHLQEHCNWGSSLQKRAKASVQIRNAFEDSSTYSLSCQQYLAASHSFVRREIKAI
jgi:hypothetical protein